MFGAEEDIRSLRIRYLDYPEDILEAVEPQNTEPVDIKKMADEGLECFKNRQSLFSGLLAFSYVWIDRLNKEDYIKDFIDEFPLDSSIIENIKNIVKEDQIEDIGDDVLQVGYGQYIWEEGINKVKSFVNSLYDFDSIHIHNKMDLMDESIFIPYVTEFDKALWHAILLSHDKNSLWVDESREYYFFYTWIYLLYMVEEKELNTKLTIDMHQLVECDDPLDIVLKEWNEEDNTFVGLKDDEINRLKTIKLKREELKQSIKNEFDQEQIIANKTNDAWMTFLDAVNRFTKFESETIKSIMRTDSTVNKLSIINKYFSLIGEYREEKYIKDIRKAVKKRLENAQDYCRVSYNSIDSFIIPDTIVIVARNPVTYNSVFISFHRFRLCTNNENAKAFFELALWAAGSNMHFENRYNYSSIDDIIESFYNGTKVFVEQYNDVLEEMSFSAVQENRNGSTRQEYLDERNGEDTIRFIDELEQSEEYKRLSDVDYFIDFINNPFKSTYLNSMVKGYNTKREKNQRLAEARQLVVSLDIIYLFCEAIRICINTPQANIEIKDRDKVNKYRLELNRIDSRIANYVYENVDISEYREKYGIDARSISITEQEIEKFRGKIVSDSFKAFLDELISNLGDADENKILEIRKDINERLKCLPECWEKDNYADWIEEITKKICDRLIELEKNNKDDYILKRNGLIEYFANKMIKLPQNAVDSLTTAEILFDRYSNRKYDTAHFDYSSISSLYYQAFETVYKEKFWREYLELLNGRDENGVCLVDLLTVNHDKNERNLVKIQYFGDCNVVIKSEKTEDGKKYISSDSTCMYGQFLHLLESINKNSEAIKLCEYFAWIIGYSNVDEMFEDNVFIEKLGNFINKIEAAMQYRNDASHGGKNINSGRCKKDRKTVMGSMDKDGKIGLIEEFYDIIRYNERNNLKRD